MIIQGTTEDLIAFVRKNSHVDRHLSSPPTYPSVAGDSLRAEPSGNGAGDGVLVSYDVHTGRMVEQSGTFFLRVGESTYEV